MKLSLPSILFLQLACGTWAKTSLRRKVQEVMPYQPGNYSGGVVVEDVDRGTKIFLSNGLSGRAIAYSGETLLDVSGADLGLYHDSADGGAVIPKEDGSGYYYVSNSEQGEYPEGFDITLDDADPTYRQNADFAANLTGGAYSIEFNNEHEIIGYQQVLFNTAGNCAGGATPWGTWISCEERREFGRCWQVDPTGETEARPTDVTSPRGIKDYGNYEAFAWDDVAKVGYVTDDDYPTEGLPSYRGVVIRYTPDKAAMACLDAEVKEDKWCALESGSRAYLKLSECEEGKFDWVADLESSNPSLYGGSEGVHVENGILEFVTIKDKQIFTLNLTDHTYTNMSVPFTQEPDNIRRLEDTLYICTDGDYEPNDGVWGVDSVGAYQVFKEEGHNYPAGVAFSPDGMKMFVHLWGEALWMFEREDGLSFADEKDPLYDSLLAIEDFALPLEAVEAAEEAVEEAEAAVEGTPAEEVLFDLAP